MEGNGVQEGGVVVVAAVAGEDAEAGVAGEIPCASPRWIQALPVLGVGLGFRKSLKKEIFAHRQDIDFLELITEQYTDPSLGQLRELRALRRASPLVLHGLDLSLGSAHPCDPRFLRAIASVIRVVRPLWWSEHIAMTRSGLLDIGHLAPLPFTEQTVETVCRNIAAAKGALPAVPLILENISYTHHFSGNELTEAEFIRAILERSDSGLLLDVMNLYANSQNHGYEPIQFLNEIPLERVVQIHVIGGRWDSGVLVDSHSAPTPAEVWDLLRYVAQRAQVKAILVEWDEQFPSFETILEELSIARSILSDDAGRISPKHAYALG